MSDFIVRIGGSSTRGMTQKIASVLERLDKKYFTAAPSMTAVVVDFTNRESIYINGEHLEDLSHNYFFLQVFTRTILFNETSPAFIEDCFLIFEKIIGDLSDFCVIAVHHGQGTKISHLYEYKKEKLD